MKRLSSLRATSCSAATPEECDAPAGCTACEGICPKLKVQRYQTIVIDPPWPYDDRINAKNRGAKNHYGLMSLEELAALPLASVSAPNSHLYLWTTNSFMEQSLVLMRAWGWTQKTIRTWVKPQMGMGRYYRGDTEHVVFGVRGKLPALVHNLRTSFVAPRGRHSAKPEVFYEQTVKLSPGPYIDVFAREERAGWTTLGNELNGERIDVALRTLATTLRSTCQQAIDAQATA